MSFSPFKAGNGYLSGGESIEVGAPRGAPRLGRGLCMFSGMSFPIPTPATHTGVWYPWTPVSVKGAVLAKGLRASRLRPQGPSFGFVPLPQLTGSTSSGTEQAQVPGLSRGPRNSDGVLLGEWARVHLDLGVACDPTPEFEQPHWPSALPSDWTEGLSRTN